MRGEIEERAACASGAGGALRRREAEKMEREGHV